MKHKKNLLRRNHKLQFAIVISVATILFALGWKLDTKNLASELPLQTDAIAELEAEVSVAKSARDIYFRAIGKRNGGAYDEYQEALICEENLNLRSQALKNLRADSQRLISEIQLREREVRVAEAVAVFEEKAEEIMQGVVTEKEVDSLQERIAKARASFEKAASDLKICVETFQSAEKCQSDIQNLIKEKGNYLKEISTVESITKEKEAEAKKKIETLQQETEENWYESEQTKSSRKRTSNFFDKIQTRNLKAFGVGSLLPAAASSATSTISSTAAANGVAAVAGIASTIGNTIETVTSPIISTIGAVSTIGGSILGAAGNIIGGTLGALSGLTQGARDALDSTLGGLEQLLGPLGISISTPGFSLNAGLGGPGAVSGLNEFERSYKGNTYGSAIGMITGWTNFLLPFVGAIGIAAIVYAGFLYLTAAGNEEQATKAKKIIIWVVIGIILIFSAYAIVNTLLGESSSSGGGGGTSISVDGISVDF